MVYVVNILIDALYTVKKNIKKHLRLFYLVILFFGSHPIMASDFSIFISKADAFFNENIRDGRVDYETIKKSPEALDELIVMAEHVRTSPSNVSEYQAFWINSYNLLVIKGIVNHYPLKSPLDVTGFFDKVKYQIGGQNVTLNEIENNLLRKVFPDEPRFHFVLVCAGLGCPPIISGAYKPDTLEAQMEEQTKLAINNPDFIRIKGNKVGISQLFEWYADDFTRNGKSILEYINQYRIQKLKNDAKLYYYPYDWTLNDTRNQ
ncbi:DUF547 domain-containing protein [Muricauda ruestringensis]|uniref:DUF547 domain-containing protein n=1 Tax=Flagellimonas ruestringensis TaxID=111501 RepID=UPI001CD1B870|nr:DUF547 domain-containing protein [Allomuricauda ruestringensis]MCA0957695.1 DUF547 domain-containing protein [Allomuricauda ruestringensis]